MRTLTGKVILPPNAPATRALKATIEVRDVSEADAPSRVVAEQRLDDVEVRPNGEIDFSLLVPDADPGHTLGMRVHIDMNGTGVTEAGDLLTTEFQTVPAAGTPAPLRLPVSLI